VKTDLTDLDYFRTKDDIIFLTKGYYHPEGFVIAIPVFWGTPDGERIHLSGKRYHKEIDEVFNKRLFRLLPQYKNSEIPKSAARVPLNDIVEVFKPQRAFKKFLTEGNKKSIWYKIAFSFQELAKISLDDVGIFGSYLVGLAGKEEKDPIKDIDFLIRGLDNFRKLRNGGLKKIHEKFGFSPISQDHIAWHVKKYGEYFDQTLTSFPETLKRKWPTLQIAPGILSTIRFVYKKDEIPANPITSLPLERISIKGRVKAAEGVHFMPRVFEVLSSDKIFRIITYFWAFYCAVKEGDEVEITGTIHKEGNLISLDDHQSGIKIIN
jgi:predicted nucleotidyltransferase